MGKGQQSEDGICSVAVQGFKCLAKESRIEIRPLTILAGANSSGKSSIMQPLLLMKQTLQASYDPGALLLNGPNVRLTSVDQLVPRQRGDLSDHAFTFSVETKGLTHRITYSPSEDHEIEIQEMYIEMAIEDEDARYLRLSSSIKGTDLQTNLSHFFDKLLPLPHGTQYTTYRDRCFLAVTNEPLEDGRTYFPKMTFAPFPSDDLIRLIHVPGLRGNPERIYERTASGPPFPGTFEKYVATIIAEWMKKGDVRRGYLENMLSQLDMTREVSVRRVNDAGLELLVGRLPGGTSRGQDLVNVADVGFGVPQVLPVLVALLVAERGQLVYVEQPELHLHPRAQYALAGIMGDAAKRGVKVVAETHGSLLLLQTQTLLAKGKLDPDLVKLHWFSRDPEDGTTSIHPADPDENGAFGDWPEDFGDVDLMAEGAYLDAVWERGSHVVGHGGHGVDDLGIHDPREAHAPAARRAAGTPPSRRTSASAPPTPGSGRRPRGEPWFTSPTSPLRCARAPSPGTPAPDP